MRSLRLCSLVVMLAAPRAALAFGVLAQPADAPPVAVTAVRAVLAPSGGGLVAQVQLAYAGPPGDLAWLLPVPSPPTDHAGRPGIDVGPPDLFSRLEAATRPAYQLQRFSRCSGLTPQVPPAMDPPPPLPAAVAPAESAVLPADTMDAVQAWLSAHHYVLSAAAQAALQPYLGAGKAVVALRFTTTAPAGELGPIGLRYAGSRPTLPLSPSAASAAQTIEAQVWLLGAGQGVPLNYARVLLNDAQIDWFAAGANRGDVAARAIAEAPGRRAFVTDYAGPADPAQGVLDDALLAGGPTLTRLYTAMAAADVAEDPSFGFNPGLSPIALTRTATLTYHCALPEARGCIPRGAGYGPSYPYPSPFYGAYGDYGYYDPAVGTYVDAGDFVDYGDFGGDMAPGWYGDPGVDPGAGDPGSDPGIGDPGGDPGIGDPGGGDPGGDDGGGDGGDRVIGHRASALSGGSGWALLVTPEGWKIGFSALAADSGMYQPPPMPNALRVESLAETGMPQVLSDATDAIRQALGVGRHAVPQPPPCADSAGSGCSAVRGAAGPPGPLVLLWGLGVLLLLRARARLTSTSTTHHPSHLR